MLDWYTSVSPVGSLIQKLLNRLIWTMTNGAVHSPRMSPAEVQEIMSSPVITGYPYQYSRIECAELANHVMQPLIQIHGMCGSPMCFHTNP